MRTDVSPARIVVAGSLPRSTALALQRSADALLLLASPQRTQLLNFKLFEYLAAARPILALAAGTEAGRVVAELGGETVRAGRRRGDRRGAPRGWSTGEIPRAGSRRASPPTPTRPGRADGGARRAEPSRRAAARRRVPPELSRQGATREPTDAFVSAGDEQRVEPPAQPVSPYPWRSMATRPTEKSARDSSNGRAEGDGEPRSRREASRRTSTATSPRRSAPTTSAGSPTPGSRSSASTTPDDVAPRARGAARRARASIRSPAASTRACTATGSGRCASTPATRPPRRPTAATAT